MDTAVFQRVYSLVIMLRLKKSSSHLVLERPSKWQKWQVRRVSQKT